MHMKKSVALLVLFLLISGLIAYWEYGHRQLFDTPPWQNGLNLENLSKVTSDSDKNLYLIHHSKQSIIKVNDKGVLKFQIKQSESKADSLFSFNDLTVGPNGELYVLRTELDNYGLYVRGERIERYTSGGKLDRVFKQIEYSGEEDRNRMLRIGEVRSLRTDGQWLYYFVDQGERVTLNRISLSDNKEEEVYSAKIPPEWQIAQIIGTSLDTTFFTTKKGDVYRFDANGQVIRIYPADDHPLEDLSFPVNLRVDPGGNLYYIDQNQYSISRIAVDSPGSITELVSKSRMEQMAQEGAFDVDDMQSLDLPGDGTMLLATSDQIVTMTDQGKVLKQMSKVRESAEHIRMHRAVWLLAAALLILLSACFGIVYFGIMERRVSIILKQIIVFVPIIVLSMVVLSSIVFNGFSNKMKEEAQHQMVLLARNGENLINGDLLNQIHSPDDFMNAAYQRIEAGKNFNFRRDQKVQQVGGKLMNVEREGLYSTLYKYKDGKIYIIMDDDDSVNMFKPFDVNEVNRDVVEKGGIVSWEIVDTNGNWLYALGPVYDSAGHIVGVYEIGKEMNGFLQHRKEMLANVAKVVAVVTFVIVLAFLILTFYLLSSIRSLRNSVSAMADGNWDVEVKVRTRDEVADLGERFNFMSGRIRNYIEEITKLSESYFRFVPRQFINYLGKEQIYEVELGDQVEREMSIMVANIRDFYKISKRLTPEESFHFINSFLKRIGPLVRDNEGLINKYLSSGILALFPNGTEQALQAALALRKELEAYNDELRQAGSEPIDGGVGIHKGSIIMGIIGEEKRLEGNVISENVNVATILERSTVLLGASILITENVLSSIQEPERYQYRNLGQIHLSGEDEALQLYDVYQGDFDRIRKLKDRTKADFERGIEFYQVGRFFDARECFVEVIKHNRQDLAAQLYFFICDEYFQRGSDEGFDGTLRIS